MSERAAIVERLMAWYALNRRDLPWRGAGTAPYSVLLSELMLQQTRVDTVIPYYERFLARWPTLQQLAAAEEEEVLKVWAGLGYYSRARNLLACARACSEQGLPRDVASLRKLPGIGDYTAGAIASIAFGTVAPVVDGNVERVITRFLAMPGDPRRASRQAVWDEATAWVAMVPDAPGDLNQALMELGATLCTPKHPQCSSCPLCEGCKGHALGEPTAFPQLPKKAPPIPLRGAYAIVRGGAGVWMGRRPKGLLGGLWEPFGVDWSPSEADPQAKDALAAALTDRVGVIARDLRFLGVVKHTFTHRRLVADVFEVAVDGVPTVRAYYDEVREVSDPETVALSTLSRRLVALDPSAWKGEACQPRPSSSSETRSSAASSPTRTVPT